jgi:anti-sigma regulatory factor (Ser/Thr protein kinase)
MDDASRVGEARRHAAQAAAAGLDEIDAGRLALVVTELGTNLQRHAHKGRLLIAARPRTDAAGGAGTGREVELISIDEGPGIPDIALAMRDGHSTGGTPGTGLGAVRRLANDFDIHSAVPDGTVSRGAGARGPAATAAGAASAGARRIGAICLPARTKRCAATPGPPPCKASNSPCWWPTAWATAPRPPRPRRPPSPPLPRRPAPTCATPCRACIARCRPRAARRCACCASTVAVLPVRLAGQRGRATVSYSGAGNIVGRVLSGVFDKSLVTQHGTAGVQIRKPETTSLELPAHALVVLHSDGIETRWSVERCAPCCKGTPRWWRRFFCATIRGTRRCHRRGDPPEGMTDEQHRG